MVMRPSRRPPITPPCQAGFTMIELVMVIVILGILTAMAVPKFVDLGKDARIATLKGLEASIRSASSMAHAVQLAQGLLPGDSITVEGSAVTMANGYPTANGIGLMMDISGFDTTTAGTFKVMDGASARPNCQVVYGEATLSGPNVVKPTTTLTTSGC